MAAVLAVPFIGGIVGRARADSGAVPNLASPAPPVHAEESLWEYLDHCSSWRETVERLREYVAGGGPDAAVLTRVADAIERRLDDGKPEPEGVLGLYPATALMLASLEHLKLYGTDDEHASQAALIRRLTEDV